jgi:hypothetical protein
MANDYGIDERYVFDFTWRGREALQRLDIDGRATIFEDGVEQDAQARGELDQVARMAEPCGAEFGCIARSMEFRRANWDSRRRRVGCFGLTSNFAPSNVSHQIS